MEQNKKMYSLQCLAFARHLVKTVKPHILSQRQLNKSGIDEDLYEWRITAAEWEMAVSAAMLTHTSAGTDDPERFLRSAVGLDLINMPSTPGMGAKKEWL